MTPTNHTTAQTITFTTSALQTDALLDRFGYKVAARLSENSQALPHDISERLRIARLHAISVRKKVASLQIASHISLSGNSAILGGDGLNLWTRLASILPLLALVAGLIAINLMQNDNRASELAEVDVALLTDDLPPAAHTDAGFAQFLKFGFPANVGNQ